MVWSQLFLSFAVGCNNPVIFLRCDLIIISLSGVTWRNWDRLNPEELTLQESSWETLLKCTEDKTCFKHKDADNVDLI